MSGQTFSHSYFESDSLLSHLNAKYMYMYMYMYTFNLTYKFNIN